VTTGGSISTAQRCPSGSKCRNADAEVITEIPSSTSGTVPLADFGQVGYRTIQVTSRSGRHGAMTPSGLWTTHAIDMLDSAGHNLALPGLARAGQAFRITWYAAS
jgi:Peptidase A4 family